MATVLWANYLESNPPWGTSQQSGFVSIGTQFSSGASLYSITALTPQVFTGGAGVVGNQAGPLVGQDGLNPLAATNVRSGDTVTFNSSLNGSTTWPTSILAGMIRVAG